MSAKEIRLVGVARECKSHSYTTTFTLKSLSLAQVQHNNPWTLDREEAHDVCAHNNLESFKDMVVTDGGRSKLRVTMVIDGGRSESRPLLVIDEDEGLGIDG